MSSEFEDIPTIESAGRLGRTVDPESPLAGAFTPPPPTPENLGDLDVSKVIEIAESLQRRVFPGSLQMSELFQTAATTYSTYYDCGPYHYAGTCSQPCFGPPPQYMNPFYCATCSERAANPAENPAFFWHYTGSRGTIQYWGENHICAGKGAWKWKITQPCGSCASSSTIRCHDGYKQIQGQAPIWTICEGLVICDGTLRTCP